ncbi:MAG: ATP-binding cassette domain-containing protein [Christensenellaceae bacterium]|jgi:ABC-type lipoprotein export system ATPase subunit|nr:ATP-binding cassette domain-containing protein [Christensenellaceae bacterium]
MIELENLHKSYGESEVLHGLNLKLPNSGMVFIVGKSGSGKTTLLNILGLLDGFTSGDLIINGKNTKDFTGRERDQFRALNIGFVFQDFNIIEKYSIGQNVAMPLDIIGDKNKGKVKDVLSKVGLTGYEKRKSSQLSGGQRQRIAIARALIKDPKIILADEPTGSLDAENGRQIFSLLSELSKTKLVVVISHDAESAEKYGDKIIKLEDGKIIAQHVGDKRETIILNKKDDAKIEKALKAGKKVLICPKIKNESPIKDDIIIEETQKKKPALSFKSAAKLSLSAMGGKWVRAFFTVLISCFAIAFFGFADIIGRFTIDKMVLGELNDNESPFVSIKAQAAKGDGAIKHYADLRATGELMDYFLPDGIDYLERYHLSTTLNCGYGPTFIANETIFTSSTDTIIENDDLKSWALENGFGFEGRNPENNSEIVINNFYLEAMKKYAFHDNVYRNDTTPGQMGSPWGRFYEIESFDDFLNFPYNIGNFWSYRKFEVDSQKNFKVVGCIYYDLSKFGEFSDLPEEVVAEAETYLYPLYAKRGFHKEYNDYAMNENIRTFQIAANGQPKIQYHTPSLFPIGSFGFFTDKDYEEYTSLRFVEPIDMLTAENGFIITADLMSQLAGVSYMEAHPMPKANAAIYEWCKETYNDFFGGDMTLAITANGITKTVKVIGFNFSSSNFYATKDFFVGFGSDWTPGYLVSVKNKENIAKIAETFGHGYTVPIDAGEEQFSLRFVMNTTNSNEIYVIDNIFSIMVGVFDILMWVFLVFAIILLFNFMRNTINGRKKDIGILRSLGASNFDVAKIFIVESVIVAIFVAVLGVIICFAGYKILTNYFITQIGGLANKYQLVYFTFRQIAMMLGITVLTIAISTAYPIIRISNKQPVEVIRRSED